MLWIETATHTLFTSKFLWFLFYIYTNPSHLGGLQQLHKSYIQQDTLVSLFAHYSAVTCVSSCCSMKLLGCCNFVWWIRVIIYITLVQYRHGSVCNLSTIEYDMNRLWFSSRWDKNLLTLYFSHPHLNIKRKGKNLYDCFKNEKWRNLKPMSKVNILV